MACEGERLEGALRTTYEPSMSYELSYFVWVVSCVPVRLSVVPGGGMRMAGVTNPAPRAPAGGGASVRGDHKWIFC